MLVSPTQAALKKKSTPGLFSDPGAPLINSTSSAWQQNVFLLSDPVASAFFDDFI
jgi:hypothetical protein